MTAPAGRTTLRVLAPGPQATVQDLGRPGWFATGVGVSGAADSLSLLRANRLVGNPDSAAGIECLLGGLELSVPAPVVVAITGAPAPITIDDDPVRPGVAVPVPAGAQLRLGVATAGLRVYLGVRGGVAVPPVLGSRSRDTLAGLGPEPLVAGDELPVGPLPATTPRPVPPPLPISGDPVAVRALPGPRDDWFARPTDLFAGHWLVSDRLDRVGIRLDRPGDAPPLRHRARRELPAEGIPLGAIQIPPSGEPVVFLADHPITGGYPVIAVVLSADIPVLAQLRPGQQLRFEPPGGRTRPVGPLRFGGGATDDDVTAILAAFAYSSAAAATPARRP